MWNILKNHLKNIILFFISVNIVVMLSFGIVFDNYTSYLDAQMNNNIEEYEEIDREQLCKITNCIGVASVTLNKCWKPDEDNHLVKKTYEQHEFVQITDLLYYSKGHQHLSIFNEYSDTYYMLNTKNLVHDYILVIQLFAPLSLILFMYPLYSSVRKEQEDVLLMLAGNEALLANKSMINITENIHHELNTPLEVIDNKVAKIHRLIQEYLQHEYNEYLDNNDFIELSEFQQLEKRSINKKLVQVTEDFEFIRTSSEQIYSVLEKMKGFKHLRYSNGNKSVKNIIDGGFKIINISNTNFGYRVDNSLAKYRLNGLKNADLLSIMLNHIKNSLEANADKVVIVFVSHLNGILKFRIVDNGNGIPQDAKSNIFKPNFSTKSVEDGIRGNGLYLNKHILNNVGGDVKVISTSKNGTTIEITIKVTMK